MSIRPASPRDVPRAGRRGSSRIRTAIITTTCAALLASTVSLTAAAAPDDDTVQPGVTGQPRVDASTTTVATTTPPTTSPGTTTTSTSTTTTSTTTTTTTTTSTTTTTTTSTTSTSTTSTTTPEPEPDATSTTEPEPETERETDATTTTTVAATTTTVAPAPTTTQPTARNVQVYPEQIQHILATIRYLESRGIYDLPPNKGNASGAYQFIGSTWNNYAGYAHAYLAPPEIQDERAALDVARFLGQFDNDVSMVPVMWYLPAAAREPWRMDVVPSPQNGNVLTIREYQTRWLSVFAFMSGQPLARLVPQVEFTGRRGEPPEVPEPIGDVPSVAFPVLGPSRVAVPDCDGAEQVEVADLDGDATVAVGPSLADIRAAGLCTKQAPAIVFGVKLQPVMAVADGIVTDVIDEPGSETPITVKVTDQSGISYLYEGFNDDNAGTADGEAPPHLRLSSIARVGNQVRAGQILGFMGDTSPLPVGIRADVPTDSSVVIDPDAVAPHIRITMVDVFGRPIDAFGPVVDALFRQTCTVGIGQWSIPANGSEHRPVTIETTDVHPDIDSQWVITSTGQVTAAGWAAMINPNEGCGYAPSSAHGPGEAGSDQGLDHWLTPVDVPTSIWVALAVQDEFSSPGGLLRPG